MTKFENPGSRQWDYPDMAKESGTKALQDAGIGYDSVEQAVVGYCYGESTCDERALYGARIALQHNLGLGGAAVVTMYRRANLA